MPRTNRSLLARFVCTGVAVIFGWAAGASIGAAQGTNSNIKPSRASTYEVVSAISPDSAPPGGQGQIVLTGQNFKEGMKIQFNCKGAQFPPDSIKVESPTRLVAQVTVPIGVQEGPCDTADLSTFPNAIGKGTFAISDSAKMPVALPLALMGEGDMQYTDIMMNMSKMMMAASQNGGKVDPGMLELDGGSIKYVKGGTTSFNESTSAVKSVEQVKIYGQPSGYFRIVFNNGKIYNFGPKLDLAGPGTDPNAAYTFLQKKLAK